MVKKMFLLVMVLAFAATSVAWARPQSQGGGKGGGKGGGINNGGSGYKTPPLLGPDRLKRPLPFATR